MCVYGVNTLIDPQTSPFRCDGNVELRHAIQWNINSTKHVDVQEDVDVTSFEELKCEILGSLMDRLRKCEAVGSLYNYCIYSVYFTEDSLYEMFLEYPPLPNLLT